MDSESFGSSKADLLRQICEEWDRAEADMKLAETVAQDVIIPAVNELRYAGRRVVEATSIAYKNDGLDARLTDLCRDALFFCHRARHDSIDAAVAQMVADLDTLMEKVGPQIIVQCFSRLSTFRVEIKRVQMNIVDSRKDRENRQAIYKTISECDFSGLVQLHNELMLSEDLMKQMARKDRRRQLLNNLFGYVGFIGLIVALLAWIFPDLFKSLMHHQ